MKYFGREDFTEGGIYPTGFHWGYICSFVRAVRLEQYIIFRIPTPFRRNKLPRDEYLERPHVLTLLAFIAWPYQGFEVKSRYLFTYFWMQI